MENRIDKKFCDLKKQNKKALACFVTSCDPNLELSEKIINSLPNFGADIIEIGIPFSDPMADGPTIQRSSLRAIKSKSNVSKTFKIIENFRKKDKTTPIILMGYFNPIFQFGLDKFFNSCKKIGIDGIIVVDLPPEENELINVYTKKYGVHNIRLITPTTDKKRLRKILKFTSGFLYYVSITGITGTKKPSVLEVKKAVSRIKANTNLPVVVGFGIDNHKQAAALNKISDGCVIGSAIIKIIESYKEYSKSKISKQIEDFLIKFSKDKK